jgi:hypothetical protein
VPHLSFFALRVWQIVTAHSLFISLGRASRLPELVMKLPPATSATCVFNHKCSPTFLVSPNALQIW